MSITVLPKYPPKLKFRELQDVPSTYVGQAGKAVIVNQTETGLEFGNAPGGGFDAPIDIVFQTLNITTVEYDANGIDIIRMEADTGNVVEYTYNTGHQITSAIYYDTDGTTVLLTINYTYDTNGKLVSVERIES